MGFNIAGVIINQNLSNQTKILQEAFCWELEELGTVSFEAACSNWKESDLCDMVFLPEASLIFLSFEEAFQTTGIRDMKSMIFGISETSMLFEMQLREGKYLMRHLTEVEGKIKDNSGFALEVENTISVTEDLLWHQIEELAGIPFDQINTPAKRYRIKAKRLNTFDQVVKPGALQPAGPHEIKLAAPKEEITPPPLPEHVHSQEAKYHDKHSYASDAIDIALDLKKLRFLLPEIFTIKNRLKYHFREYGFKSIIEQVEEHIRYGDSQPAIVAQNYPFLVAAYNVDIDAVVMLRYHLDVAEKFQLKKGDRLICVNTFGTAEAIQADIIPGPDNMGNWQSVHPIIADFVSSSKSAIEKRKAEIGEEGYQYVQQLAEAYLEEKPDQYRDGRPFYSRFVLARD
ncbi:hypothetical protein [Persicobacter diffluens]|uniref:Uncharacterized protein n=1 Tax=Persicobacter diffluens TaxID=981 RepID=A0AAN4VY54_9BACT|nr:hypothetical protein PEDI_17680 [Persicobacter diffluens]